MVIQVVVGVFFTGLDVPLITKTVVESIRGKVRKKCQIIHVTVGSVKKSTVLFILHCL